MKHKNNNAPFFKWCVNSKVDLIKLDLPYFKIPNDLVEGLPDAFLFSEFNQKIDNKKPIN
jgi:hypothetical protein